MAAGRTGPRPLMRLPFWQRTEVGSVSVEVAMMTWA